MGAEQGQASGLEVDRMVLILAAAKRDLILRELDRRAAMLQAC